MKKRSVKKRPGSTIAGFPWKYQRFPNGFEFFNYPTHLARRLFHYVVSIGVARCPAGFVHGHENEEGFLLHFVRSGELRHWVNGKQYTVRKGGAILLDLSGTVRYGNEGPRKVTFDWVLFDGKDMHSLFKELQADFMPVFTDLNIPSMRPLFRELMRLIDHQPVAYEMRSSSVLGGLVAELFEERLRHQTALALREDTSQLSDPVRKGINFMTRLYHQRLLVKEIAAAAGQSLHHFTRVFHRETGHPPMRYLNRYRVEEAKRLLGNSDKPIATIGRLVGIPRNYHFAHLFRQLTGMTPRSYRKKHGWKKPVSEGTSAWATCTPRS